MELILVRHGQPRWVVDGRNQNDPELTERGHAQAALMASRIADETDEPARGPVDHLLVSPARRAQQTAAPIVEALGLTPVTHDWLLELGMPPEWDGHPIETVQQAFAAQNAKPREEWWDGLPGAEGLRDFHDRVSNGIDALLAGWGIVPADDRNLWRVADDAPERVVAVAHAGTNSTIVAHLLGVEKEPWDWERFAMSHASVAVLRTRRVAGEAIWALTSLGDAAHIPLDDRTR